MSLEVIFFCEDGKVLCEKSVSPNKTYDVVQYINTTQHKDSVKNNSKLNQQLLARLNQQSKCITEFK